MSANLAAPAGFEQLEPGFTNPVGDAQACFRAVLDAMAHPGRIVRMPDAVPHEIPLGPAAASVALSLCDIDTPIWLDEASSAAGSYLTFHCGAPLAETPAAAAFAFVADAATLPPLLSFSLGSDDYPERATTLVIEVAGISNKGGLIVRGPGILSEMQLSVAGLPERFWSERAALAELFPRGLDILFTCGSTLVALPRSTLIVTSGAG
jgi:alpha-D-ribose 1-methylphosphonate 5-triphosphate synthase subunit PhnH